MTGNRTRNQAAGTSGERAGEALRSELRSRADLVTIAPPPVLEVRRNARRRLRRRRTVQGFSGVVVTCAVVAGVVAWSPKQDDRSLPGMTTTAGGPTPTRTTASPSPTPAQSSSPSTPRSTSASDYLLLASDLGSGWTGPEGGLRPRSALEVGTSQCESAGDYHTQQPVTPAPNHLYSFSAPGQESNNLFEAIYTFAPGTGPTVLASVRTALKTGCGQPNSIKLLSTPATAADEAIVFTVGGNDRNVMVRSGDRVASAVVEIGRPGQDTAWFDGVVQQMANRLVGH